MKKRVAVVDENNQVVEDLGEWTGQSTQPREPAQETANRSTVTNADRADDFHRRSRTARLPE